jgi:hypothetical protein
MMNFSLYPAKDRAFLQAQENAKISQAQGHITRFCVGHNREIGRYIEVMIDGVWCPYPWWQEFHEDYFENSSGF